MTAARIGNRLGLTPDETALLTARGIERLGRRNYAVRELAFLVATDPRLERGIPRRLRIRAIRSFLHCFLNGPAENLLYAKAEATQESDA